jgi:hypothetical protein
MKALGACATSAVHFEHATALFKAAGFSDYQLVPGLVTSSWCALPPGQTIPQFDVQNDNFLGWFSSQRETIETVVAETIAPMAMHVCRASLDLWELMPFHGKLDLITRLANSGAFSSESVLC